MNRKYLVAIKVLSENNSHVEGNQLFDTDGPLTAGILDTIKEKYCAAAPVKCLPEKAVIYAVIPLDT